MDPHANLVANANVSRWQAATAPARPWDWLFAAALVAAVFAVYYPAWRGGFIMDDDLSVFDNPASKPGGLASIWVPGASYRYWPLTFAVHKLQYDLWGTNPLGYHLTNIALHAAAALLAWRVFL